MEYVDIPQLWDPFYFIAKLNQNFPQSKDKEFFKEYPSLTVSLEYTGVSFLFWQSWVLRVVNHNPILAVIRILESSRGLIRGTSVISSNADLAFLAIKQHSEAIFLFISNFVSHRICESKIVNTFSCSNQLIS